MMNRSDFFKSLAAVALAPFVPKPEELKPEELKRDAADIDYVINNATWDDPVVTGSSNSAYSAWTTPVLSVSSDGIFSLTPP